VKVFSSRSRIYAKLPRANTTPRDNMASADYAIARATSGDVTGIVALQESNLRDKGGALSVRLSPEWFAQAIVDMPIMVARRAGGVVGYVVSSSVAAQADIPIVRTMLRAYPGTSGAYIYGPICVAESERGRGLAATIVQALREQLPGREGFTFIRADNAISREVHRKLGMREVAQFDHADTAYVIVAYSG
jgi:L-amino acid N-acyltransferase YncA